MKKLVSKEYTEIAAKFNKTDGVRAILLFMFIFALWYGVGSIKVTDNVPLFFLEYVDVFATLLELVILGGILYFSKEALTSVGITKKNLIQSILLGVIGAIIIITINILINGPEFELYLPAITLSSLLIFSVCAIGEELIVRGYITNRLNGFTNNFMFSSTIAAFLFAFSHYAVKWGISGIIDFSSVTPIHFVLLIILHFLCDFVYKKTNCIWGSAVLHILYNVCSSALIFIS